MFPSNDGGFHGSTIVFLRILKLIMKYLSCMTYILRYIIAFYFLFFLQFYYFFSTVFISI